MTMTVLERARASGKFPPSLLRDIDTGGDGFEEAVVNVLDGNGTSVLRLQVLLLFGRYDIWKSCLLTFSWFHFVARSTRTLPKYRAHRVGEFQEVVAGRSVFIAVFEWLTNVSRTVKLEHMIKKNLKKSFDDFHLSLDSCMRMSIFDSFEDSRHEGFWNVIAALLSSLTRSSQ
jgi:hypothetical protein